MDTSKIAVFHGAGRPLTLATVPIPPLRAGEILVRIEYTTLCRSDLNTCSGRRIEKTPTILGHEIAGTIVALDPAAPAQDCRGAELQPGQRVTWAIYAANPASPLARLGIPQKAAGLFKYGHELIQPDSTLHGGLAEYCILRRHTPVIRLDPALPLPLTALINCSVATVAGSLRLAGPVAGRNVVIGGAGMLGVIACAMCHCAGAHKIIAVDIDETRLAIARKFGAEFTVLLQPDSPPLKETIGTLCPESVLAALDYSGAPATMEALINLLGIGGTAVFVGATHPERPLQISAEQLIRNLHTLKGLHNYNETDFIAAVEFMEQNHGQFPFASLIEDKFDLDTVNEAFDCGMKSGAYRVGIRIGRNR